MLLVCDFQCYPAPEGIVTNINRLIRLRISQSKTLGGGKWAEAGVGRAAKFKIAEIKRFSFLESLVK